MSVNHADNRDPSRVNLVVSAVRVALQKNPTKAATKHRKVFWRLSDLLHCCVDLGKKTSRRVSRPRKVPVEGEIDFSSRLLANSKRAHLPQLVAQLALERFPRFPSLGICVSLSLATVQLSGQFIR